MPGAASASCLEQSDRIVDVSITTRLRQRDRIVGKAKFARDRAHVEDVQHGRGASGENGDEARRALRARWWTDRETGRQCLDPGAAAKRDQTAAGVYHQVCIAAGGGVDARLNLRN